MKIWIIGFMLLSMACTSKSDDSGKKIAALAVISQSRRTTSTTSSSCTANYNCATAPSFSTLATAGTTASCALSGCHTTSSQQSGLDITDFNSARAFTNPGNPCSSRMYTAITTGAMVGNTNARITEAVYCWIAGGSNR
ncbi:MAG TPA: hypothetical protein PK079_12975 [Leptospiraceae bacterium]|nr:hypothetical protein [Leptospiraceae bacterium]HMW07630.1 hypothetical protein [Leptospiraceae bacterium]HMX32992.1 hypothetical protein [Leptospiraceae bacterium]HMY33251.1 hypothetical protein [Leptospiraceae bacterium]HMZ66580.1 hypothetical protein [Leptospiraceae bacterium]